MIYTVGHSNRTLEELIDILRAFNIETLVDVRGGRAGSRTFPHFNKENLMQSIPGANIDYVHLGTLGGRRGKQPITDDSLNAAWRLPAFRYYADYAYISDDFRSGLEELVELSNNSRVAYMCSEAVPWRCHRTIVTDYVLANTEKTVTHITGKKQSFVGHISNHAVVVGDKVTYPVLL